MKIIGRCALAAAAAASLMFATSAPAGADVAPHKHCVYTPSPEGYVLIAEGVSLEAPNDPALESFHYQVHRGVPGEELGIIIAIPITQEECPPLLTEAEVFEAI
jgi:hypothetical protein